MNIAVVHKYTRTFITTETEVAFTFWERAKGLIGCGFLSEGRGILLYPCCSVHTFFVHFPIDVIFMNEQFRVIDWLTDLKPYHFSPVVRGASYVLELPAGTVERLEIQVGDELLLAPGKRANDVCRY